MTVESSLQEINDAILDLQGSDYNTYARPLKKLAHILESNDLRSIVEELKNGVDFEAFIESADPGGSMVGSASLNWPTDREEELGLTLIVIERGGNEPDWFWNFAYQYYYGGNKLMDSIRKITSSVIVPLPCNST